MLKPVSKYLIPLFSGFILFSTISCKHEPETLPDPEIPIDTITTGIPCNPDTSYFQNDVLPILISSCAMSGCHDAASAQDGVVLISYQTVITTGDVRPGNPGNSDIYEKITDNDPEDRMPPPPMQALSPDQIEVIRKWIAQGAKNNRCDSGCDTAVFTYSGAILPIINNNCKGCHSGATPSGNVNLDSYTAVKTAAESGRLYGSVAHLSGYSPMPQGGKLSDCNITQIRKWIENGTPND
jgi:mono/diheme cytochrome c family protein